MSQDMELTADGEEPIEEMRGMLSSIDFDEEMVESVSVVVTLDFGGGDDSSSGGRSGLEHDGEWEYAADDPGRVTRNTHQHIVLVVMQSYFEETGADAVEVSELAELEGNPLSADQTRNALNTLFNQKALLKRRTMAATGGGKKYLYAMRTEGRNEADRLGNYNLNEARHLPDDEG